MTIKILVPFDFSEPSEKALLHAFRLSSLISVENEIILLHVIEEISSRMALEAAFGSDGWKKEEEKLRKNGTDLSRYEKEIIDQMQKEMSALLSDTNIQYKPFAIRYVCKIGGNPADRILEIARSEACDFIILGNVGHTGLAKMFNLGSVSREVLEKAPCPTTVVH